MTKVKWPATAIYPIPSQVYSFWEDFFFIFSVEFCLLFCSLFVKLLVPFHFFNLVEMISWIYKWSNELFIKTTMLGGLLKKIVLFKILSWYNSVDVFTLLIKKLRSTENKKHTSAHLANVELFILIFKTSRCF